MASPELGSTLTTSAPATPHGGHAVLLLLLKRHAAIFRANARAPRRAPGRAFNPFMCGARPSCTNRHRSLDSRVRLGDGVSPECSNESSSCVVVVWSAPCSAIWPVAEGPLMNTVRSRTLIPARGPSAATAGMPPAGRARYLRAAWRGPLDRGLAGKQQTVWQLCLLFFF